MVGGCLILITGRSLAFFVAELSPGAGCGGFKICHSPNCQLPLGRGSYEKAALVLKRGRLGWLVLGVGFRKPATYCFWRSWKREAFWKSKDCCSQPLGPSQVCDRHSPTRTSQTHTLARWNQGLARRTFLAPCLAKWMPRSCKIRSLDRSLQIAGLSILFQGNCL